MPSQSVLKAKGLHSANNRLGTVPEGALQVADNVIIRWKDVIEPRRGHAALSSATFGTIGSRANSIWFYRDTLMTQHDSGTVAVYSGGTLTDFVGTFTPPTNALGIRTKAIEAQQDLYFTSSTGIQYTDALNTTPAFAGVKRALDFYNSGTYVSIYGVTTMDIVGSHTGNGDWMATNTKVGYRVVWYKKDVSLRKILGAPSGRSVYANSSGSTQTLQLFAVPPQGITSKHSYQVYRTYQSLSSSTDPGDNYYLAFEGAASDSATVAAGNASCGSGSPSLLTCTGTPNNLQVGEVVTLTFTAADIAQGFVNEKMGIANATATSFTGFLLEAHATSLTTLGALQVTPFAYSINDTAPDTMLGQALYTNPNDGDGSLVGASDNAEPPLALDVAYWNFSNWYANTVSKQRYQVQLLGVNVGANANPSGLVANDTITIGGQTYTAVTSLTANGQFLLTSTSGSASLNVEATAKSLVSNINNNPSNTTIVAYYVSSITGAPGLIQLEESGVGGAAFNVSVNRATAWAPNLAFTQSSTADAAPNRLFYSKPYQPEAVPLLNYMDCGSRLKNILRIIPLRDKLYVFKEDGIFIVSGQAPYRVDLLDNTARVIAPETVTPLGNQIYALSNQGVVTVSELGVQLISQQIEDVLLPLMASLTQGNGLKTAAWAAAYESEHLYILGLPITPTDTTAGQIYAYNYVSGAWARWPVARTCARVNPATDLLYLGDGNSNSLLVERKNYNNQDFADGTLTCTISTATATGSGVSLALTGVTGTPAAGDSVNQGNQQSPITSVSGSGTSYTVVVVDPNVAGWSTGQSATIYQAIPCEITWQLNLSGPPGMSKHWSQGTLHFRRFCAEANAQAEAWTEYDFSPTVTSLSSYPGWGQCVWDSTTPVTPSTSASDLFTPWGQPSGPKNERFLIGSKKQRSAYLSIGFKCREAFADWVLEGITVETEAMSERTTVKG